MNYLDFDYIVKICAWLMISVFLLSLLVVTVFKMKDWIRGITYYWGKGKDVEQETKHVKRPRLISELPIDNGNGTINASAAYRISFTTATQRDFDAEMKAHGIHGMFLEQSVYPLIRLRAEMGDYWAVLTDHDFRMLASNNDIPYELNSDIRLALFNYVAIVLKNQGYQTTVSTDTNELVVRWEKGNIF